MAVVLAISVTSLAHAQDDPVDLTDAALKGDEVINSQLC